jgi:hypothetical protein
MAQGPVSGLFQWLRYGTGATADQPTGLVDGGDLNLNPDLRKRLGIGGTEVRKGGVVVPMGSASMYVTDTNQALFAAGLRTSYPRGGLTELEFAGGANAFAWLYHDAVITDMTLAYARGDGLKGTVAWGALGFGYNETGGTQAAEAGETLEDYEFVIKFEGDEYYVNAWSASIGNNVSFFTSGNTKVVGAERLPTHRIYGAEEATFAFSTDVPLPLADLGIYELCMPTDLEITLVGTGCDNTMTITVANLAPSEAATMAFVDNSTIVGYAYGFAGSAAAGSLSWLWA